MLWTPSVLSNSALNWVEDRMPWEQLKKTMLKSSQALSSAKADNLSPLPSFLCQVNSSSPCKTSEDPVLHPYKIIPWCVLPYYCVNTVTSAWLCCTDTPLCINFRCLTRNYESAGATFIKSLCVSSSAECPVNDKCPINVSCTIRWASPLAGLFGTRTELILRIHDEKGSVFGSSVAQGPPCPPVSRWTQPASMGPNIALISIHNHPPDTWRGVPAQNKL